MNLAIQGHSTRESEVIALLGMLGGNNAFGHIGNNTHAIYYIDENYKNFITCSETKKICDYIIFTLEEFLEKFPYKVGDKVIYNNQIYIIEKARWNGSEIAYTIGNANEVIIHTYIKELQPYKEETMEKKKINQMSLANCDLDEVEIVLGDKFELKIKDSKYYAVRKKTQYPNTYEECCKVLGCKADYFFTDFSFDNCDVEISDYEDKIDDLLQNFRKLIYCRDAYWKIAGNWKPEWLTGDKYTIHTSRDEIVQSTICCANTILVFPIKEMRDAFYENFKELIETCKELL